MANDLQDTIQEIVNRVAQEGSKGLRNAKKSSGGLSGVKGIAAGAGVAALAPLAAKGIGKAVKSAGSDGLENFVSGLGDKLGGGLGEGGGAGGAISGALKSALPFGGGDDDDGGGSGDSFKDTVPGVGKKRRMPVQQSVDIGAPVETVYNQWTQYELWPSFMHRVTDVTQKDQCTVNFSTKIWGKKKEFVAKIETQRPDERVKWKVEQGITHTGVVTFHEIGPRLTRVLLNLDVDPGGMLEKAARGLRHVKRAARADLHRFKAFIEIQEVETGAWRGVIENGKVVEDHDESYDKDREYSKFEDVFKGPTAKKKTSREQRSSSSGGRSGSGGGRSSSGSGRSSSRSGRSSSGGGRSSSSGRSGSSRGRSGSSSNGGSSSSSSPRSSSSRSSSSRGRSSNHSEGRSRTTRRRS